MYILFFFIPQLWTNYFYMDFGNVMDSHRLDNPFSMEERSDFDFSILSTLPLSSSPPEFTSSSPTSDIPSDLGNWTNYFYMDFGSVMDSHSPDNPFSTEERSDFDFSILSTLPLSSSPPEFTSSSPTSDISSDLGKEEGSSSLTSASSGRSDIASISCPQHSDRGQLRDQFSQRLHDLLVLVLRGRELARSRTEEADCTTCTSRSDDSDRGSDNQVLKQTRYNIFAHIYALEHYFWD